MVTRSRMRRIEVDFSNLRSIKKAERMKMMLENKGYNLKSSRQVGFDKFVDEYEPTNKRKAWTAKSLSSAIAKNNFGGVD